MKLKVATVREMSQRFLSSRQSDKMHNQDEINISRAINKYSTGLNKKV